MRSPDRLLKRGFLPLTAAALALGACGPVQGPDLSQSLSSDSNKITAPVPTAEPSPTLVVRTPARESFILPENYSQNLLAACSSVRYLTPRFVVEQNCSPFPSTGELRIPAVPEDPQGGIIEFARDTMNDERFPIEDLRVQMGAIVNTGNGRISLFVSIGSPEEERPVSAFAGDYFGANLSGENTLKAKWDNRYLTEVRWNNQKLPLKLDNDPRQPSNS